jgi:hypothetical protein
VPPPPAADTRFAVCGRADAAAAVATGIDVVVVLAPGEVLGPRPPGAGRIAVLVGDGLSRADLATAAAFGAEVFGAAAVGGDGVDART